MSTIKNSKVLVLVTIFATALLIAGSLTAVIDDKNAFAKKL